MAFEFTSAESERKLALGELANGEVVFDRPRSHLTFDQENYKQLLSETLREITGEERDFIVHTKKFASLIGTTLCVETKGDSEENITYAIRKGRTGYTRFVKDKVAEPTDEFTVVLRKIDKGYVIITAFVGPQAEREPWDNNADEKATLFWNSHALIWDPDSVILNTVKNECPW